MKKRFIEKIIKTDTCWIWIGAQSKGYGSFGYKGRQHGAHRISYFLFKGKIPQNMQIDHLCRNPLCVNPKHLEAVSCRENLLRGNTWAAKNTLKTHCLKGHILIGQNLMKRKDNRRVCRECVVAYKTKKRRAKGTPEKGKRTHCKFGHEFTKENTYIPIGTSWKLCKTCQHLRYLSKKSMVSFGQKQ